MADGQPPESGPLSNTALLAKMVRDLMEMYGYSVQDVAALAKTSRHVIYGIINQSRRLRTDTAPAILEGVCFAFELLPWQTATMTPPNRVWREKTRSDIYICAGFATSELVESVSAGEYPIPKRLAPPDQGSGTYSHYGRVDPKKDPNTEELPLYLEQTVKTPARRARRWTDVVSML